MDARKVLRFINCIVGRIRRNHALEHATIHMLIASDPTVRVTGRSDNRGFTLCGRLSSVSVDQAVRSGLRRMRAGEHHWAVHPNCGTNLVTAGMLASVAALIAGVGWRDSWRRRFEGFPLLLIMVIVSLLISGPIGMAIQRNVATDGALGDLDIVSVTRRNIGGRIMHRVETHG